MEDLEEKGKKTMKSKMKELTAPLPLKDIELRIGHVKEGKSVTLLAYKNSRADVKRLNEVFGSLWKPEYRHDKHDNLVCRIYIFDTDINEWIGREDVGVPSFSEKVKGEYSDALKRAGFRWGIGTELYDMPFIYIPLRNQGSWYERNGKLHPKIYPQNWKLLKNDNGNFYILTNKGEIIWEEKKSKTDYSSEQPDNVEKDSRKTSTQSKKSSNTKKKYGKRPSFSRMNKIPMGYDEGKRWKEAQNKNIKWIADHIKDELGNEAKKELEIREILRRVSTSFSKTEVADAKKEIGIVKLNDVENLKQAKKLLDICENYMQMGGTNKTESPAEKDEDDFLF